MKIDINNICFGDLIEYHQGISMVHIVTSGKLGSGFSTLFRNIKNFRNGVVKEECINPNSILSESSLYIDEEKAMIIFPIQENYLIRIYK